MEVSRVRFFISISSYQLVLAYCFSSFPRRHFFVALKEPPSSPPPSTTSDQKLSRDLARRKVIKQWLRGVLGFAFLFSISFGFVPSQFKVLHELFFVAVRLRSFDDVPFLLQRKLRHFLIRSNNGSSLAAKIFCNVRRGVMGRPEPYVLFAQTFTHPLLDEYVDEVLFAEPIVISACEFLELNSPLSTPPFSLMGYDVTGLSLKFRLTIISHVIFVPIMSMIALKTEAAILQPYNLENLNSSHMKALDSTKRVLSSEIADFPLQEFQGSRVARPGT
ncbi:hypothetical protein KFK09_013631 [Dendrobium nobile]|uniref:Uncharacterized protein n=1 Tax=Dendrobium nobile TaxID=94219 RepID=A0A8T3BAQ7_DENNO|nr:hypothetical protein KFK09_013631 [Dendrobium nobile]